MLTINYLTPLPLLQTSTPPRKGGGRVSSCVVKGGGGLFLFFTVWLVSPLNFIMWFWIHIINTWSLTIIQPHMDRVSHYIYTYTYICTFSLTNYCQCLLMLQIIVEVECLNICWHFCFYFFFNVFQALLLQLTIGCVIAKKNLFLEVNYVN